MKSLFVTTALCALTVTAAQAQTSTAGAESADNRFQIFFPVDSAELDATARETIAEAADDWTQGSAAQISVVGHADTTGTVEYNRQLSERRAEAVKDALAGEGIPADEISTAALGEDDLLVPTSDGVRQDENRRVEIIVPAVQEEIVTAEEVAPAAPEPLPPAAPTPTPPEPEPETKWFTFALGPVYGKNFGENDNGAENDLVGAELSFEALPDFLGGVSLSQMVLWSFNGIDDGLNGRTVASLDFAPDFGIFRPALALNGGVVYGEGLQDGFVVGPELRFDLVPVAGFDIGAKVAYDYQFSTNDFEEGIVWAGLDLGIRF